MLIINIKRKSDNDVESETETDTGTERLFYGQCQYESELLTKENKEKEIDDNV